jgi:hypothetical protein
LHRRTLDAWLATVEDLEAFAIEASFAAVAVRVLDEAVFEAFGDSAYTAYRRQSIEGRVVVGLELIRNAEIHSGAIVEHDSTRIVSVPTTEQGTLFRFFPRWKQFDELPEEYRQRGPSHMRARGECQDAYRKHVQGRLVMETLLDAIAFFHRADPSIIPTMDRASGGVFPLPDLACRHDERLSPDWPSADRWYADEIKRLKFASVPAASWRELAVQLVDDDGVVVGYGGWTPRVLGIRDSWVERRQQVERDVRAGYRYVIRDEDDKVPLSIDETGRLVAKPPGGSCVLSKLPLGTDAVLSLERLRPVPRHAARRSSRVDRAAVRRRSGFPKRGRQRSLHRNAATRCKTRRVAWAPGVDR